MEESKGDADFEPTMDSPTWLGDLNEARWKERAVAAERPDAHHMGATLEAHTRYFRALVTLRGAEKRASRHESHVRVDDLQPMPGSPASKDLVWGETLRATFENNPVVENLELVHRLIASALDHLEGLAHLTAGTNLIRSPISVARSAMEAAAVAAFLCDPTIHRQDRLRRALNVRLAELGEARWEHSTKDEDEGATEVYQRQIDTIFQGIRALGMGGSNQVAGSRRLPFITPRDSSQGMIRSVLEDDLGGSLWRNMSAVAHSRDATWLLMVDAMDPHAGDEQRRARDVAFNCIPALLVMHILIPRLNEYLGWDLSECLTDHEFVVRLWLAGAGMNDAQIRERLFGEGSPD